MTKTVAGILRSKGYNIFSVKADATVLEALQIMANNSVGALLVMEAERLVGIMSERDYARKVILLGKSSRKAKVKEIMSGKVLFVHPHRTAEECMAIMINKRVRHLPVIENNALVGVISIGDIVKAVIDEKSFVIEQLEEYITGRKAPTEA
jgi:CBS domain-containing protein